eukprot:TRINITY_DN15410_c0_g1_i3.p2 TRINITY_DN15410_c0_g1~~TRINITY_DN15410_c0_g1_i3.p2  ORF type:complete len:136 (+),score=22.59 TRINITY_DN15410_c0_g1_i3:149-556(+)
MHVARKASLFGKSERVLSRAWTARISCAEFDKCRCSSRSSMQAADTPPVSAEAATAAAAAALAAVREATQPASHRSALTPATRVGLKTAWDPYLAGQGQQSATNLAAAAAGRQFENRGAQELSQPAPKRRRQAAS